MKRALALTFALGLAACASAGGQPTTAGGGKKAPDFSIQTTSGKSFRLADHLGKDVVVVDFWTTFCQPCVGSLMHLEEVYKKRKADGFVVIGVSMDPPETAGQVVPFVKSHDITFPMAHDADSRVTELYNKKSSAPYSVLIARDGTILKIREAFQAGDEPSIDADIDAALSVKP